MRLKLSNLPERVVKKYNIKAKATRDGYVHVEIRKGMYGLLQAGLISQQLLEKILNNKGYQQSGIIPGFWMHEWRPIFFSLCVDDFVVKYLEK